MTTEEHEVKQIFRERARDGQITCAECLALARELGFPAQQLGPLLKEMDIKIVRCQLGCFP